MGRGTVEKAGSACFAPHLAQLPTGVVSDLWRPSMATETRGLTADDHRNGPHSRASAVTPCSAMLVTRF